MVPLVLFGYLLCNVLLAWATLHKSFLSTPDKPYPHLHHKIKMNGYIQLFFKPQTENSIDLIILKSDLLS